ncbi:TonB-dependent receptor, partial [Proteus mirabilis]|uniref:TonB-dependent receptor n=1 Tax=Proteus mirabilis TaxID=584 RepID=UPI00106F747B
VYGRSRYENRTRRPVLLAGINEYLLGPKLGVRNGVEVYAPDPARLFQPLSPNEYQSLSGYQESRNAAWLQTFSASVNGRLFALPGGDAALAAVVEAGSQGYRNRPDPRLGTGEFWNTSAGIGAGGERDRYAAGVELQLPLLQSLTTTLAGRYDQYRAGGEHIGKATWSFGVEFRPIESLLFRGKYGTAFRAPTLSDAFQGRSGYYANGSTDYYRCGELGYTPGNTDACRYADSVSVYSERAGNPDLEPITADVWNAGIVWAPMANLSISADYYNWKIKNEVNTLSSDQLLLAEYYCRNGQTNNTSASCQNVNDWITRDGAGKLEQIYTPKMNIASQNLQAVTASFKYVQDIGRFGSLQFSGNYTDMLKRELQPQPGDEFLDLLRDPYA